MQYTTQLNYEYIYKIIKLKLVRLLETEKIFENFSDFHLYQLYLTKSYIYIKIKLLFLTLLILSPFRIIPFLTLKPIFFLFSDGFNKRFLSIYFNFFQDNKFSVIEFNPYNDFNFFNTLISYQESRGFQ